MSGGTPAKLNPALTWVTAPICPSRSSDSASRTRGCQRYQDASTSSCPAPSATAAISATSSAVRPSGFSQSTVLPASERLDRPGQVRVVGQADVDGVDVGVVEQLLVGAVGPGRTQLAGPFDVARGDREQLGSLGGRQHERLGPGDLTGPEQPPAGGVRHVEQPYGRSADRTT